MRCCHVQTLCKSISLPPLTHLSSRLTGELPAIKHIVYFDDETAGDESKGKQAAAGDAAAAAAAATAPTSDLNIEDMKVSVCCGNAQSASFTFPPSRSLAPCLD